MAVTIIKQKPELKGKLNLTEHRAESLFTNFFTTTIKLSTRQFKVKQI